MSQSWCSASSAAASARTPIWALTTERPGRASSLANPSAAAITAPCPTSPISTTATCDSRPTSDASTHHGVVMDGLRGHRSRAEGRLRGAACIPSLNCRTNENGRSLGEAYRVDVKRTLRIAVVGGGGGGGG